MIKKSDSVFCGCCIEAGGVALNEITLSAIVFICVAAFVAGVFFVDAARKKRLKDSMRQYCAQNGFQLRFWDNGNEKGHTVQSEDWILRICMPVQSGNAETGNPGTVRETEWLCDKKDERRPAFALYCSMAQCGFETLPEWVRTTAITQMKRAFPGAAEFSSVRTAFCEREMTCLAFENKAHSAQPLVERIRPVIGAWNGRVPICIECTPERVRIIVRDCFLEEPEKIDAIIRLGKTLTTF
jgi:hypothetical protein